MKKNIILSILFLMLSCASDDNNSGSVNCTEVFVYGLKVTVKDAITSSNLTDGLTVTASDGSYQEVLMRIENSDYFIGAGEREGTYVIEITSNDYQTFTSNTVIVEKTEDDCHVITEELEFTVQPN